MWLFGWLRGRSRRNPKTEIEALPNVDLSHMISQEQRRSGCVFCDKCNRDVPFDRVYAWPRGSPGKGFVDLCLALDGPELLAFIDEAGPTHVKQLLCEDCLREDSWYRHKDGQLFEELLAACKRLAERHLRADGRWR